MDGSDTQAARGNAFVQFYRWVFGIGYERNVGGPERTLRYILGAVSTIVGIGIGVFPVIGGGLSNTVLALLLIGSGLFLIYEAQVQYCPLNHTFSRNTYTGN